MLQEEEKRARLQRLTSRLVIQFPPNLQRARGRSDGPDTADTLPLNNSSLFLLH